MTEAKRALVPPLLRRNAADGDGDGDRDAAAAVDAREAACAGLAAARPARDAIMTPAISCRGAREVMGRAEVLASGSEC